MLIRPKHQKLILRLKDPDKVLNLIPTSRKIEYMGRDFVVVPHRLDEVKVLKNIKLDPPHPVDHYYNWPGRYTPMEAQRETVRRMTTYHRGYCLNALGTGKSLSSLWAFDYLRSIKKVRRALIIAPLSTLDRTWADELLMNFPHLNYAVLHGTKYTRRRLLAQDNDVYIINHDGVKVIKDDLIRRTDINFVIIDELSQAARNAKTERWKILRDVIKDRDWVWGLTGTPIPNEPTDAWAQCRLITPETVPQFYSSFRDATMQQMGLYKWVPRENALETVYQAMQPSVRFKREDCIDLPPCMYETRVAALTPEQERMWKSMYDTLHAQHAKGDITAVNEAVKMGKLLQIVCGAAIGEDEKVIEMLPKPRIDVVLTTIEEAAGKVIVFVPYKAPLAMLYREIGQHYHCEVINGTVPRTERDRIFSDFQDPYGKTRVLLAQPAAMSHGLTLTEANVIVWFAPITSAETYEQANGRITRPGQKNAQFIIHLQATSFEEVLYQRLKNKTTTQGVLLEMFK